MLAVWFFPAALPVRGAQVENLQGLSELFAPPLPHLDDTPPPSIKGGDAADGQTGGREVRPGHTHAVYVYIYIYLIYYIYIIQTRCKTQARMNTDITRLF